MNESDVRASTSKCLIQRKQNRHQGHQDGSKVASHDVKKKHQSEQQENVPYDQDPALYYIMFCILSS